MAVGLHGLTILFGIVKSCEYVGILLDITITMYVLSKMGECKTHLQWMGYIQYYDEYLGEWDYI